MGAPSFLGIKILDIAIFIVYTLLIFTIGRMYGYYENCYQESEENEDP